MGATPTRSPGHPSPSVVLRSPRSRSADEWTASLQGGEAPVHAEAVSGGALACSRPQVGSLTSSCVLSARARIFYLNQISKGHPTPKLSTNPGAEIVGPFNFSTHSKVPTVNMCCFYCHRNLFRSIYIKARHVVDSRGNSVGVTGVTGILCVGPTA